jgi:hypothetical protein
MSFGLLKISIGVVALLVVSPSPAWSKPAPAAAAAAAGAATAKATCKRDVDCVLLHRAPSPCRCLRCDARLITRAQHRAEWRPLLSRRCAKRSRPCKQCKPLAVGAYPACQRGRCVQRVLPKPMATRRRKSRDCKRDSDCTFAPPSNCGCGPCGPYWRQPANKRHAAWVQNEQARESCKPMRCKPCTRGVQALGSVVACLKGQCSVIR